MDYISGFCFEQKVAGMAFVCFNINVNLGGHGFEPVAVDPEEQNLRKAA
jgi:hypothetical protein